MVAVRHTGGRAVSVVSASGVHPASDVVSSMPLSELVAVMDPPAPPEVRAAAEALSYRDFLTVAVVVPAEAVGWEDNWLYIHDPAVAAMRVQNFGAWSPGMVKPGENVLGLEYAVDEGDGLWSASDAELVERAKGELGALGLVEPSAVRAGYVVRMPKAYPYYDCAYAENVGTIRAWLSEAAGNLWTVGRNGMHRYNNQDHSMMTGWLAAENVCGASHDPWAVNVEAEYHETAAAPGTKTPPVGTGRAAPVLPARR